MYQLLGIVVHRVLGTGGVPYQLPGREMVCLLGRLGVRYQLGRVGVPGLSNGLFTMSQEWLVYQVPGMARNGWLVYRLCAEKLVI